MKTATIEELLEDFAFLDTWEERYRYIIELDGELDEMPEHLKTEENHVQGCASQNSNQQQSLTVDLTRAREDRPSLEKVALRNQVVSKRTAVPRVSDGHGNFAARLRV